MESLESKRYWIGLTLISNLSPRKFHILLDNFSSPQEIWETPLARLKEIPGFAESAHTFCMHREKVRLEETLKLIADLGLRVITLADPEYPESLRSIPDAPPVLYQRGDHLERDRLAIAIVGTRQSTDYGRKMARRFAQDLGKLGFTIVSGLAEGIDTAAHRGALQAGARTIAVLGSGFAHLYPQSNHKLLEEIVSCGYALTEFAPGVVPEKWTFPQRNRIISGLSRGVLVVEAPERSGARITARHALEQGREVFVVPGPVSSDPERGNRGGHQLIQQGAKLVEDIDDIIAEFQDLQAMIKLRKEKPAPSQKPMLSPLEAKIFSVLEFEPTHFDEIVSKTGLSVGEVSEGLLTLSLQGLAQEIEGKRYLRLT
ncbi:DNA-processing protein DprA [Candidatus Acetothermia bacterium]|jgi:DNA processing protein|nr:DNA-processing protein DprA [Candidatus Acetothermia bacterium]MCI2431084.1 DNA-processing protein DprA [Candidatus Acetothermia bacterium]MCI2435708.1 DNA-processing protein DprA [Candidatus Acetothermia bacterium]